MKGQRKRNFSLLELLASAVIMVILIALIVPAFYNMTKGQNVEMAVSTIASKLKSVRSYAISQSTYAAFVFIKNQAVTPSRYSYKSYRACLCVKNGDNYDFVSWFPDSKWDFLPTGTVFRSLNTTNPSDSDTFIDIASCKMRSVNDPQVISNTSLPAVIFKSSGELVGSDLFLVVGEGYYSGNNLNVKNSSNKKTIAINDYTGRVSIVED